MPEIKIIGSESSRQVFSSKEINLPLRFCRQGMRDTERSKRMKEKRRDKEEGTGVFVPEWGQRVVSG